MKKLRGSHIMERGEKFLSCWKELASQDTSFAGIGHQELKDEMEAAKIAREQVQAAEMRLRSLRFQRDQADRKLAEKLMRLASGVRAEPGYGEDSGFYRALGFVPLSENRSGRPRKPKTGNAQDGKNRTGKERKPLP